ncbi:MAG: glycosyltransferase family 39 protein [Candidatus Woesearchaeota archaeon]
MDKLDKGDKMDKGKYWNYAKIILIITIILRVGLALMTHNAGDGCWHLSAARFIALENEFPLNEEIGRDYYPEHLKQPFWAPPVFHITAAGFYKVFDVFNAGELGMNLVSALFGSLSLILIYLIAKRLFDEKIAFFSLVFLSFIPIHMYYSALAHTEATLTFFVLLSIYLMLKNKVVASSIFAGIAILTKYNGLFVVPVLLAILCINNKDKIVFVRNAVVSGIISLGIGGIWFVRNWIFFKNPVFPFLESVLRGTAPAMGYTADVTNFLSVDPYMKMYFSLFGVPLGDINSFFFFDIPYIKVLIGIWVIGTIIFFLPIIIGLLQSKLKDKRWQIIGAWIISFAVLGAAYVLRIGQFDSRHILPMIPALGILWAIGIVWIYRKIKFKYIVTGILMLLIIGFVSGEVLKAGMVARAWNNYDDDFQWVKENTEKDSIFFFQRQCLTYNLDRYSTWSIDKVEQRKGYIWVQDEENIVGRSLLANDFPEDISSEYEIVYENTRTATKIYKIV